MLAKLEKTMPSNMSNQVAAIVVVALEAAGGSWWQLVAVGGSWWRQVVAKTKPKRRWRL